jgi:hypothetical protein
MIIISIRKSKVFFPLQDKCNNVSGKDAITAELIREGSKYFWRNIYKLIISAWQKEAMPEEWQTAIICPILKKAVC